MSDRPYLEHSELGRVSHYSEQLDAGLLFPIARADARAELGLDHWSYAGADVWYAYELSWLAPSGVPQMAIGRFTCAANSPCLIESKSFKLYLNSYAMTVFAHQEAVMQQLMADLSAAAGAPVQVALFHPDQSPMQRPEPDWSGLDNLAVTTQEYAVNPKLLALSPDAEWVHRTHFSHLLRSNCPVTGQPDWGTVVVAYEGPEIAPESLLRYIISYRTHTGFHEQCVERIFLDVLALAEFSALRVQAHYLRRGGLDINPWRALHAEPPDMGRWPRQ